MRDWKSLVTRNPWLLPFLYALVKHDVEARPGELARALGVRSRVARAALRSLRLVVEGDEALSEAAAWLAKQEIAIKGRRMAWRLGRYYVLVKIRSRKVSTYTVPVELVDRARELLRERGISSARELARELDVRVIEASRALQVLEVIGAAVRSKDGYVYRGSLDVHDPGGPRGPIQ